MILCGSDMWLITEDMLRILEGFHHRSEKQITGMIEKRGAGRDWEYPLVVAAMEAAGIHPIREYIRRQKATISVMAACRPMYELSVKAEYMP